MSDLSHLTQLGQAAQQPQSPEQAVLERVGNPHPGLRYCIRFTAPEFTSLCPLTGQPDFAHLVIDYVPDAWIVESKSLKLYLASFRNHGAFHEACTLDIAQRLMGLLTPHWLRARAPWAGDTRTPSGIFGGWHAWRHGLDGSPC